MFFCDEPLEDPDERRGIVARGVLVLEPNPVEVVIGGSLVRVGGDFLPVR
jgi:hypothetical protein